MVRAASGCDSCVVQRYLSHPLLLDGFKFDLRLYVFVASCDPLRIFLFPDGLVRLATELYRAPDSSNIVCYPFVLIDYKLLVHSYIIVYILIYRVSLSLASFSQLQIIFVCDTEINNIVNNYIIL